MREKKKLIDVFTDPFSNGIFHNLQAFNVPWKNEYIANELEFSFMSNYGSRNISPMVKISLDDTGKLTADKIAMIAGTIFNLNRRNWEKQYETMLFEYNPIENYSMTEKHTGTETGLETPTNWKETETQTPTNWKETETQTPTNWKETETQTPTNWKETETQTPTNWIETTKGLQADNEADANNSIYAFNSNSAVKVSESESKVSSKSETERTGTFQTDKEQTGTFQTDKEQTGTFQTDKEQTGTFQTDTERTGTYEDKTTYDTTLTRKGNIGVTTSQQMIESERELWLWNFFQNVVFKDVSKALTLSIY